MFPGKNPERFFTGWFIFVSVLSLAWIGFLVWAIYTLVTHFTS